MSTRHTYETIISRRSIRGFEQKPVDFELLKKYVNAGRLAPQAANRQPLEFVIVDDKKMLGEIFEYTKLAGYIDWKPTIDKKAMAYIAILADTNRQKAMWIPYDVSLAAQNICLAAWEDGIGSCMIGAFNKSKIKSLLDVPMGHEMVLLIALGYPAHKSFVEEKDAVEYWRDDEGNFHVPKRPLELVLHHNKFISS